eukprot:TRINITY_DN5445_c0_g1_i1.p1 TRINITY_DN5445_c0_g1~~TRINITY_DN5445_c0_g1_i1.p1  ORF type:complete len:446 (-),score=66.06 TRINITY_DN5445_c0_g1_i1:94-1431(-)
MATHQQQARTNWGVSPGTRSSGGGGSSRNDQSFSAFLRHDDFDDIDTDNQIELNHLSSATKPHTQLVVNTTSTEPLWDGEVEGGMLTERDVSRAADRKWWQSAHGPRRPSRIVLCVFVLVALTIVFGLLGLAAVIVEEEQGSSSSNDARPEYRDAITKSFYSSEITVPATQASKNYTLIDGPDGDIVVREVTISLVDLQGRNVVSEQVYNHHTTLARVTANNTYQAIFIAGAETTGKPLSLPEGYGMISKKGVAWVIEWHLLNPWGLASLSDMKVRLKYTIVYNERNSSEGAKLKNAGWRLLGIDGTPVEFPVPGDGGPGSVWRIQRDYKWGDEDCTIVLAQGHVHIGSINTTLYDLTNNPNSPVATCVPSYAPSGYIANIPCHFPRHYTFKAGSKYRLVSYYDNSQAYGEVMSLMGAYTTCSEYTNEHGSDIDPNAHDTGGHHH